ncbi:MAG: alpha/beta hydrolase [bacterium]
MKVRGAEIATRTSGAGPVCVWGHGLLGSMAQEDDVPLFDWAAVAARARLVRYDARSHGISEIDLDPAHLRWPELGRDMLALADAHGARRACLGGVSMGCATSLHAAVLAPARVAGLVLMAPPTAWETRPRQARFYRVAATLVEWAGLAPFRCLASLPGPARSSPVAALQSALVAHLADANAAAVATALRGAAASDLPDPDSIRALRAPALILAWVGDSVHPTSSATRLADLLPHAELHQAATLDEIRAWPERVARFVATWGSERGQNE